MSDTVRHPLLTPSDAAVVARESERTVWRRIRAGRYPVVRKGGRTFIDYDGLMATVVVDDLSTHEDRMQFYADRLRSSDDA
jgi:hypothetical protein